MRKYNVIAITMATIMGTALASCSSDELSDDNGNNNGSANIELKLQKAVEMECSSNDIELVENVGNNDYYYKVQDNPGGELYKHFASYAPAQGNGEAVTVAEKDFVIDYIKNHKDEGTTEFNHYNYFIQYVGQGENVYSTITTQNPHTVEVNNAQHMDKITFYDENGSTRELRDYNTNGGPRALVLNTKITDASYEDSYGTDNRVKHNLYKFFEIEYNGEKNYYIGFDYTTEKSGEGLKIEPDGIYNDYVIKLIPACDTPEPAPVPDPSDPSEPIVETKGHVEVNLAANDHKDEESSKLSVHVRDTCDFKIYIPVADTYYCAKDDMYIVEKHYENMTYNNLATTMERTIDGQTVTLNVTYAHEGIYIESNGINSTVLKYLRNVYGDGITFEINNYYNPNITRTALLALLNQSTIEFKNGTTADYRNTIAKDDDGNLINKDSNGNLLDCIVTKKD